jgi:DNA-binding XRE family transcriptional regulator
VRKQSTSARWSWVDASPRALRAHRSFAGPGHLPRPLAQREARVAAAIGREITRLRIRDDVTQLQLAARLGISQPQVSYLTRGYAIPALSLLFDLADVFGEPPAHWFAIAAAAARPRR